MIHRGKALVLATLALLATSALVVSVAQAQYTASSYPTTVTATSSFGNEVITTEGSSVECSGHFQGILLEASTTLTLVPTYTSCSAFGFASATVTMNGCAYVFHDVGANTAGRLTIECPWEKSIQIVAGNCEISIGAQGQLSWMTTSNASGHVNAAANVGGIHYTVTKDGFLCPLTGIGDKYGGTYDQESAVTLAPTSGGSSIWVD